MNIKKLLLVFVTALIAQFSFALAAPASVALASSQVQQSNRVVDFHSMLDAGTYGIYSDATLLNGPPATGIKTAIVVYAYKDNYDKVVNQTVFDSDGSGWQEYYDYGTKKWSAWSQFGGGGGQKGDKGDKGDTGPQGLPGVKGDTGAQGIQGVKGDVGAKGDTGVQGIQGIQGVAGKDGANGKDGKDGLVNPMTATGDMIYAGANGFPTRLGAGVAGQVLTLSNSAPIIPIWQTPANILSFNVPISSVYADAAIPAVVVLKNSSGTTQLTQNGLLCNSTGLMNITQQFSLVVASGQTISISGRLTFYNISAITQSNYYVNIQVLGLTTGGQLVNLGTQTQTTLSKAQYGYTNANFSAKQTLVTDLIAIGIQAQVVYAEANNTAVVNTMFAQVTIL
ncbi:MAG: collagen-like protein [Burkholderiales bacterium]|nr:collagen-like protein [Burkholderiales bacterium]